MFIRVKKTPNSPRRSVQIVESFREGGKVRQRIVRHVGVAHGEDELDRLKELAQYIKARLLHERKPALFPPDTVAEMVIQSGREAAAARAGLPVNLEELREEQRLVTGIHEVHGQVYRELGFDRLLSPSRQRMSHRALFHTVMARIANPESKRASVTRLARDFGVALPVEKVYRMMDLLDEAAIRRLKGIVAGNAEALFPGPLDVLFFDCTTLHFESQRDDALRQFGYSKDGKHGEVQVLLALMVTRAGLPVSYEVFPGATWEGHSFLPMLERMRKRQGAAQSVYVADAGMFSKDNLAQLEAHGCRYVVGARLRNLPQAVTARVLAVARYRRVKGTDLLVGVFRLGAARRLVVTWSPKRARKDAHDRRKAVARLIRKLSAGGNPKQLLSQQGLGRFVRVQGDAQLVMDDGKVAAAERWDGLHGVITNLRHVSVQSLLERYRGLWQVEESFRITKHDLRARPVFHWTPRRVRAHLAIAFMAFACVRHLAYRVALRKKAFSPRVIRDALLHRQCSLLRHQKTATLYGVPSKPTAEAQAIYDLMGLTINTVPFEIKQNQV